MSIQTLALAFMAATAIGGLAWVFIYPSLSGQRKAESRRASIARSDAPARQVEKTQRSRREQVEGSLKELDARRRKEKSVPLTSRLAQAGLGSWTPQKFWIASGVSGAVGFVLAFMIGRHPLGAAVMAFATGLGLPRWVLGFLKKRRENTIIETQTIGMPLGEACARLYERMPLPEANFFGIVVAIQQKSGGNLSEALGNLSKVLRDRKKMGEKIQAMSMEAKASAGIIGSLPPVVMLLVWISTPDYISLLWTHQIGQFMLLCCVGWMTIGVLVMKKMINFDF